MRKNFAGRFVSIFVSAVLVLPCFALPAAPSANATSDTIKAKYSDDEAPIESPIQSSYDYDGSSESPAKFGDIIYDDMSAQLTSHSLRGNFSLRTKVCSIRDRCGFDLN